jgi:hypothetical protein
MSIEHDAGPGKTFSLETSEGFPASGAAAGLLTIVDKTMTCIPAAVPHSLDPVCDAIRTHYRDYIFAQRMRLRIDLALAAFLRMALGWRRDLPAADRNRIAARALELVAIGERIDRTPSADPDFLAFSALILASIQSRGPFDDIERAARKEMECLAKSLPVWQFCEPIKGVGAKSLAVIVGEAGNLARYPAKGHLFKRMGLAVIDGIAQGKLEASALAADWVRHGYNPSRRAQMAMIGEALIKAQNPYREAYLARKEAERAKAAAEGLTVAPATSIPKRDAERYRSDGHIHNRALRYAEQRLLRDLLREWKARQ